MVTVIGEPICSRLQHDKIHISESRRSVNWRSKRKDVQSSGATFWMPRFLATRRELRYYLLTRDCVDRREL